MLDQAEADQRQEQEELLQYHREAKEENHKEELSDSEKYYRNHELSRKKSSADNARYFQEHQRRIEEGHKNRPARILALLGEFQRKSAKQFTDQRAYVNAVVYNKASGMGNDVVCLMLHDVNDIHKIEETLNSLRKEEKDHQDRLLRSKVQDPLPSKSMLSSALKRCKTAERELDEAKTNGAMAREVEARAVLANDESFKHLNNAAHSAVADGSYIQTRTLPINQ